MIHHIEKLRERPNHEKKRIAFFASAGVTFVIFAFWLASFNFQNGTNNTAREESILSPFKAVTDNIAGVYGSIVGSKETFKKIMSGTTNVQVEVVPAKQPVNAY